jgi:hypothetical protein
MSKYTDMYEFMDSCIKSEKRNSEYWQNRYIEERNSNRAAYSAQQHKASVLAGKVEAYEKLLAKFFGENPGKSDELFMFEGRCYKPVEHDIHMEGNQPRKLTVEFVEVPLLFRREETV